jgi:hypothetical protein
MTLNNMAFPSTGGCYEKRKAQKNSKWKDSGKKEEIGDFIKLKLWWEKKKFVYI